MNSANKKIIRWTVRLVLLACAVVLAVGGPLPIMLARIFPSLSPLASAGAFIAQQRWYPGLLWAVPPVAMLALGVWKGRLFCRWICPLGTLYALPSGLIARKTFLKVRPSALLFWMIVGAWLVGVPLLLWLDPLATFNRLTPLVRGVWSPAGLVLGLIVPLMLILGAIQPMIWCTHLCPLGYCFELARSLRRPGPKAAFDQTRRSIIAGLLAGVAAAMASRRWLMGEAIASSANLPILPPGAKNPGHFASVCTRCYACVNACPMHIIQVPPPAGRSLLQWFQPELKFTDSAETPGEGYCDETCINCSQVCPTGAIMPLTLRQKRQRLIGTAKVIRPACLAWADNEYCMVCQEHCSYGAILTDESKDYIPRPVVNDKLCRGCGFCQSTCPAIRNGKAIVVCGINEQTFSDDGYADLFEYD